MAQINMDAACVIYKKFLAKYAKSSSHSIGSSLVYEMVSGGHVWLLQLLMGIAGYTLTFEKETAAYFSADKMAAAGITDPVNRYSSKIAPWSGKTSSGKNPYDPVSNASLGIGIAHYQAGALASFYSGATLTCSVPTFDAAGDVIIENGSVSKEGIVLTYENVPVRGWGVAFGGGKKLDMHRLFTDAKGLSYSISQGVAVLTGKMQGGNMRWVGKLNTTQPWMDAAWQKNNIIPWCTEHLEDPVGCLFPPLKWFADYWVPAIALSLHNKQDDVTHSMLISAIANSAGFGGANKYAAYDAQNIVSQYVPNLGKNAQLAHDERRMVNTLRAIEIVKFIRKIGD